MTHSLRSLRPWTASLGIAVVATACYVESEPPPRHVIVQDRPPPPQGQIIVTDRPAPPPPQTNVVVERPAPPPPQVEVVRPSPPQD